MHVLILSANTGGGHNSAAAALTEQLKKANAECTITDALALIDPKVSKLVSKGHNYIYRRHPHLFGTVYRYEEHHSTEFIYEQCAHGAERLAQLLQEGNYDGVICTHVFSGMMLTEAKRKFLLHIPSFFIATDYTCSPGVNALDVDTVFIPHRSLLAEFVRCDIRADRLFPSGIPVRQDFCRRWEKQEAKRMLHLPEDRKMVLLACGSMGCGHLDKQTLFLLEHLPEDVCLTVLCGNNEQAYQQLLPHISERLHILRYTDIVGDLLSAADLYITKPGGLSVTEAIVKRTPMLLVNAVPGCETHNYDFLLKAGIARGASKWKQVPAIVAEALENEAETAKQIELMEQYDVQNAAEVICKHVLSVCKYGQH